MTTEARKDMIRIYNEAIAMEQEAKCHLDYADDEHLDEAIIAHAKAEAERDYTIGLIKVKLGGVLHRR